jgi:hypothetical protein
VKQQKQKKGAIKMSDKIDENKIHETKNYALFVVSPFNRNIAKNRWLRESLLQHGWIRTKPLDVRKLSNGKFEIRDGHHRFMLAQELDIPVKFAICNDDASIQELNLTDRPWSIMDILAGHVRLGKSAYVKVYNFHKHTGIPVSSCIGLLSGNSAASYSNQLIKFKEGTYCLGNPDHAVIVGEIIIHCQAVGIPFARNNYFVQAVSKIAFADDFDPKIMVHKITAFSEFMIKQPSKQHYVKLLDEIYNRKSQKRVPLEFQADQAARKRAVTAIPGNAKSRRHCHV